MALLSVFLALLSVSPFVCKPFCLDTNIPMFQEETTNEEDTNLVTGNAKYLDWSFNVIGAPNSSSSSKVRLHLHANSDLCCFCKRRSINHLSENFYKAPRSSESYYSQSIFNQLLSEAIILKDTSGCIFGIIDDFALPPWVYVDDGIQTSNLVEYHLGLVENGKAKTNYSVSASIGIHNISKTFSKGGIEVLDYESPTNSELTETRKIDPDSVTAELRRNEVVSTGSIVAIHLTFSINTAEESILSSYPIAHSLDKLKFLYWDFKEHSASCDPKISLDNDLNDYFHGRNYINQKYLLNVVQVQSREITSRPVEIILFFEVIALVSDDIISLTAGSTAQFTLVVEDVEKSKQVPGVSSAISLNDDKIYVYDVKGITLSFSTDQSASAFPEIECRLVKPQEEKNIDERTQIYDGISWSPVVRVTRYGSEIPKSRFGFFLSPNYPGRKKYNFYKILARFPQKIQILQDSGRKYLSCKNLTEKYFLQEIHQTKSKLFCRKIH